MIRVNVYAECLTLTRKVSYNPLDRVRKLDSCYLRTAKAKHMSHAPKKQVSSRVLKLNIGFLLNEGPGNNHTSDLDFPHVRVADDLNLKFLRGPLTLSRTQEGILVQAELQTALDGECYRCLDVHEQHLTINLEELYHIHWDPDAEFYIHEDGILDLGPLLREEVMIEADFGEAFRPDKAGICRMCGIAIQEKLKVNEDEYIDPRLAVLKQLLDSE